MARYLFCLLLIGANALIAGVQVDSPTQVVEPFASATDCRFAQQAMECRVPDEAGMISSAWAIDAEDEDFQTRLKLVCLHLVPGGARAGEFAVRLRQGALALNCSVWSERNLPLLV